MTWELVAGDRKRCTVHDPKGEHLFGPRESCADCKTSPALALIDHTDDAPPPAPPEGCLSAEQLEKRLTDMASFIEDKARALCKGGRGKKRIEYSTAFKGFELAIKAYSAAGEYTRTRERRANVRRMERAKRSMRALRHRGGSN